jgi:acyl-CoA reductase-like NAD-dependent aldehyde dehydrogenase
VHDFDLTGANLIGGKESSEGKATFASIDPRTGASGRLAFREATQAEVSEAVAAAVFAFRSWPGEAERHRRTRFLRAAAACLRRWREAIVSIADGETGLGAVRLNGELDRTCDQIDQFATLIENGSYIDAIVSPADPQATPAPRPDIRRMLVPVGPVAVFTPSNFPLAFGSAGGDTVSALAAGCPVIVKGHPAHPATSEACGRALRAAAAETGMPPGIFSLLQGRSVEVSQALAREAGVKAIAFTGSHRAGRAIHDIASARAEPIPVYAEMGSLNPVFISPAALASRGPAIADGLAASIMLGTGQFCTKPGLVFVQDDEAAQAFASQLAARVAVRPPGLMLYPGLQSALSEKLQRLRSTSGVEVLTPVPAVSRQSAENAGATAGSASFESGAQATASNRSAKGAGAAPLERAGVILSTDAATFLANPALRDEYFGPVSIVIRCGPGDGTIEMARQLEGSLTATVHAEPSDHEWAAALVSVLVNRVGRLVWNGFPTGVTVIAAMHHGGPYPASTCPAHSSVGTTAIRRFLRPVAFQNVPEALLPEALRD